MTTKRTTRQRRAKSEAPAPDLSQQAVAAILEAESIPIRQATVDADTRRALIATEAYFISERRGFAAGRDFEDWLEAEEAVDARLRSLRAA